MILQEKLFSLRDEKYAAFSAKLIPTVAPDRFIGVRSPQLRALANELKNSADEFLSELPHRYHEENMLHAYLLCGGKKYENVVEETEKFLPYVDNWAVCDSLVPRVFARHKAELLPHIKRWMEAEHEYTVRFAIGTLMRYYLDADFRPEHLTKVAAVNRGEYYIQMMQAWYFATALAKQWDATLPVLDLLEGWVRGKTIQKALESYRVTDDHKRLLIEIRKN
ncbi:MAG: DNA alkylation repair protein [bacterium]